MGKLFPISCRFSHFPIAMASVYFDGIRIQLIKLIGEICTELALRTDVSEDLDIETSEAPNAKALNLLQGPAAPASVNRILRSAEYFFDSEKKLIGPMTFMFAFHVAFGVPCQASIDTQQRLYRRELRWCHMISLKYEEARLASLASLDLGRSINGFFEMLTS